MASPEVLPPETEEGEVVSGGTLSQLEEADRKSQVAIAKQYPRSITIFRQKLTEIARQNQAVAMEMMYSLPRAGKQLVGPSIRFAEAILSCWGNDRAGVEVVDVDTKEGYVVAEGRFYDCENNAGIAVRVRRRNVMTKKDADSYQVTGNAASSIALRNAILRGVPKALWADIFETAKQTAAGSAQSLEQMRTETVKLFGALGITNERLFRALGVNGVADIGTEEILAMKAWHKQLINKDSTIEDIFGFPEDAEISELQAKLGFNEAQKRQSAKAFSGKSELLAHLKAEVAKMGGAEPQKAQAKSGGNKAEPQPVMQAQPDAEAPKSEDKPKDKQKDALDF